MCHVCVQRIALNPVPLNAFVIEEGDLAMCQGPIYAARDRHGDWTLHDPVGERSVFLGGETARRLARHILDVGSGGAKRA